MDEEEIWKPVPGYENLEASSLGRIREFRILPQSQVGGTTYLSCKPLISGEEGEKPERKTRNVHKLVALAFLGPPPEPNMVVNHIDTNRHNNRSDNFEWTTYSGNTRHAVTSGVIALSLSQEQMDTISVLFFDEGKSMAEIARQLNITVNQVKSTVMIWRQADRKGRVNPHERTLETVKEKQLRKLEKLGWKQKEKK
jgi:predicted DNA-binding protein YlxM (UPF0122 family)